MAAVFLASYGISVRKHGSQKRLDLSLEKGPSLLDIVTRGMRAAKRTPRKIPNKQHLLRTRNVNSDRSSVWGIVERGAYGYSAAGIHATTFEPTYDRTTDDAELVPLYFRFHLPAGCHTGLLVLQRMGNQGVASDVREYVSECLSNAHQDHTLVMGRVVPDEIMTALKEGVVREVRYVTHTLPSDVEEKLRLKGTRLTPGTIEISLKARRNGPLWDKTPEWVRKMQSGATKVSELFDERDSISLAVDYRGRKRHYRIDAIERSAPYLDVSDEIAFAKDGHPEFQSIDDFCREWIEQLKSDIGQE